MSAAVVDTDLYRSAFGRLEEEAGEAVAPWLRALRRSAMERFETLGFPTTRNEEWKYTSVAPIVRTAFAHSRAGTAQTIFKYWPTTDQGQQAIAVNGHKQPI